MKKITDITQLVEGKQYLMVSRQFNDAKNLVNLISKDYTGLNRKIGYFVFSDRVKHIPTKEQFLNTYPEGKQGSYINHLFALWDNEIQENTEIYQLI